MATLRVGGEVDAFCTRCKLTLAHTILAMMGTKIARVRCNTCGGDHAYRTQSAGESPPAAAASPGAPRERAERTVLSFQAQMMGKDHSKARDYSPKERFQVDDLMRHPSFGLGIVAAVRGDKIEVSFKSTVKTLVHGRGGGGERPAYHAPHAQTDAPADKPLPREKD